MSVGRPATVLIPAAPGKSRGRTFAWGSTRQVVRGRLSQGGSANTVHVGESVSPMTQFLTTTCTTNGEGPAEPGGSADTVHMGENVSPTTQSYQRVKSRGHTRKHTKGKKSTSITHSHKKIRDTRGTLRDTQSLHTTVTSLLYKPHISTTFTLYTLHKTHI